MIKTVTINQTFHTIRSPIDLGALLSERLPSFSRYSPNIFNISYAVFVFYILNSHNLTCRKHPAHLVRFCWIGFIVLAPYSWMKETILLKRDKDLFNQFMIL